MPSALAAPVIGLLTPKIFDGQIFGHHKLRDDGIRIVLMTSHLLEQEFKDVSNVNIMTNNWQQSGIRIKNNSKFKLF